jgi:hypothetical protein
MAVPQLLNFRGVQPKLGSNTQKLKSLGGSHRPRPGDFRRGQENPTGKAHEAKPRAAVLHTHHPRVWVRSTTGPGPSRAFPTGFPLPGRRPRARGPRSGRVGRRRPGVAGGGSRRLPPRPPGPAPSRALPTCGWGGAPTAPPPKPGVWVSRFGGWGGGHIPLVPLPRVGRGGGGRGGGPAGDSGDRPRRLDRLDTDSDSKINPQQLPNPPPHPPGARGGWGRGSPPGPSTSADPPGPPRGHPPTRPPRQKE